MTTYAVDLTDPLGEIRAASMRWRIGRLIRFLRVVRPDP